MVRHMSQPNFQDSIAYYIYNSRLNEFMSYHIVNTDLWNNQDPIIEIFDEGIRIVIANKLDFEVGGEQLIQMRDKIQILIEKLIANRKIGEKGLIQNVNCEILRNVINLNIRNKTDYKIFSYNNILEYINDAILNKYNLKFVFDKGINPYDIK